MTFTQIIISIFILVFYAGVWSVVVTLFKELVDDLVKKEVKGK